jgi:NADH-quinone oxidoreductase subunit E
MAQIGKDYYEDLTPAILSGLLDRFAAGEVPVPGPQNGRYSCEPLSGLTSLKEHESGRTQYNASVQAAVDLGDTVRRIDGSEVPLRMAWMPRAEAVTEAVVEMEPVPGAGRAADATGITVQEAPAVATGKPVTEPDAPPAEPLPVGPAIRPQPLAAARGGAADDLTRLKGVGPVLARLLNDLGVYRFDQIAAWTAEEVAWVDENLEGFKGRVSRDDWVAQAKAFAAEAAPAPGQGD